MTKEKDINEGVVTGDHGYDATNIASGESSGNFVNTGPETKNKKKRKKTFIKRSKIKEVLEDYKEE